MQALKGWTISVGLVLLATAANAQVVVPQDASRPRYVAVSDFSGPYADVPPGAAVPGSAPMGYGPVLLPPREVYAVLRESGFSPLGIPRLRGMFYIIAAVDRRGEDGRLVIDARNGRIIRFLPSYRFGDNFDERAAPYAPLPPMNHLGSHLGGTLDGPPRPPAAVPKVASRVPPAVPVPKAAPVVRPGDETPLAEKPASLPNQQSAAVQAKPADAPRATAPAADAAKPAAPAIQSTQPMPQVQDLE
jgi:hypothetical protein